MSSETGAPAQGAEVPGPSLEKIRAQQNFGLAVVAGVGAAIIGAVLWAVVTVITQYELGLMAIAVGFLVGFAIRETGKGVDKKFGYLGAICGLFGCVLGNLLSGIVFYAQASGLSFGQALATLDVDLVSRLASATFQAMDLLFYAIGIYEGYKFSFKYRINPAAAPA
jgi:hypothetical protein